nr:MAG TPA: hypothetical protein [Caudoviricetes sp.]
MTVFLINFFLLEKQKHHLKKLNWSQASTM